MCVSTTETGKKEKGTMSIVTVVSFDGSSKNGLKIAMAHTDGSMVTLTTLVDITKAGMIYMKDHGLNKMFEISGVKAIVETKENGNEQS
jgi:hypothetical protein